ncbi:MAG: hypothetical protein ACXV5N_12205, partial [Halobacteriota archaeon]
RHLLGIFFLLVIYYVLADRSCFIRNTCGDLLDCEICGGFLSFYQLASSQKTALLSCLKIFA